MSFLTRIQTFMPIKRRKDSGAWEVSIPRQGKPPLRRSSATWTYADAKAFEQTLLVAPRTLEDALDKWLAEYVPFLRHPNKYVSKANVLRPYLKDRSFQHVPDVVAAIRRDMAHRAPATINRILSVLRRICHLAYKEWDWVDKPVGQKIRMLTEKNERHYYLSRAEVELIRSYCTIREAGNLVVVSAFTGLRRSELLSIGKHSLRGDELHLTSRTKNGRPRVIPLHPRALHIIREMPYKDISPAVLRKQWEHARKKADLDHINWHDLRHTFASWMIQSGTPLHVLKELMGHASITMTMRYAHLATDNLREAIQRL